MVVYCGKVRRTFCFSVRFKNMSGRATGASLRWFGGATNFAARRFTARRTGSFG